MHPSKRRYLSFYSTRCHIPEERNFNMPPRFVNQVLTNSVQQGASSETKNLSDIPEIPSQFINAFGKARIRPRRPEKVRRSAWQPSAGRPRPHFQHTHIPDAPHVDQFTCWKIWCKLLQTFLASDQIYRSFPHPQWTITGPHLEKDSVLTLYSISLTFTLILSYHRRIGVP
jgi:hypothetical protein